MYHLLDGRAFGRLARIVRRLVRADESDRRSEPPAGGDSLTELKARVEEMQRQIERLAGNR